METILIISTLVAFLFTIVIWKIWKWFEFEAYIAPAIMEDFCKAFLLVAPAIIQAAQALTELGMVMERTRQQKHKLQPGGIVGEIWMADKDGKYFVVEEMEAGEQKDGVWPVTVKGYPIGLTKEEIILRGRASGKTPFPDGEISFDGE